MKTNMKKTVLLSICAVLLVALSVLGTVAYFTDTDNTVSNTFTVGKVKITLDESKVTEYGVKDGASKVAGNQYKLIPGKKYVKDPVVHVESGSETSYLFIKVENGIANIETTTSADKIASQITANNWTLVNGQTNVYYKKFNAKATPLVTDYPVFQSFTVKSTLEETDLTSYASATVKVTAYAIQAEGFDGGVPANEANYAKAAWAELSK